jgi:hypothetical protein
LWVKTVVLRLGPNQQIIGGSEQAGPWRKTYNGRHENSPRVFTRRFAFGLHDGKRKRTRRALSGQLPRNHQGANVRHVRRPIIGTRRFGIDAKTIWQQFPFLLSDQQTWVTNPWIVCVRANAKNRMGGFTGKKVFAVFIQNGKVIDTKEEGGALWCADHRDYAPFPELTVS